MHPIPPAHSNFFAHKEHHQSLSYLIYLLVIWTGASIITIALCLVKCYNQKRFLASKCITGVCDQAHPGSVGGGLTALLRPFSWIQGAASWQGKDKEGEERTDHSPYHRACIHHWSVVLDQLFRSANHVSIRTRDSVKKSKTRKIIPCEFRG